MTIRSVDNQTFTSNNERYIDGYNPRRNRRQHVDEVINLDDASVRRLAYAKTVKNLDDEKHRKLNNYLLMSVPFAAGLSSALLNPAKSSVLSKSITGTAARLLNGAKSTALWGMLFGLAGAISAGRNYLEKKSPEFDKFTQNNPLLTFVGSVGAFAGVIALGNKALPKVLETAGEYIDAKSVEKLSDKLVAKANGFNNNKFVKAVAGKAEDIANNKYLAPLKSFAKTIVSWAPMTLLCGSVVHAFNHGNAKREEFAKNYTEIKDFQHKLAKARIRELAMQNRYLMQEVKNSKA